MSLVLDRPDKRPDAQARLIGYAVIFYFGSWNGLKLSSATLARLRAEFRELEVDISELTLR